MVHQLDYGLRKNRTGTLLRYWRWILCCTLVLVLGGAGFVAVQFWEFQAAFGDKIETISTGETSDLVARYLTDWGLFGPFQEGDPDYAKAVSSKAHQITGINGLVQYDFHGHGDFWFEVTLTPELADQLRSALKASTTIRTFPGGADETSPADWWPGTWPTDARCYDRGGDYLVLPDSGTRAWFRYIGL